MHVQNPASDGEGNESDEEGKGETSWKQQPEKAAENAGLPGDAQKAAAKSGLPEAKEPENSEPV